ncbi:hypothetical protein EON82_11570 [bacterium]|nr:MAG: hypothetical protein EON82_11570 [bacterium]
MGTLLTLLAAWTALAFALAIPACALLFGLRRSAGRLREVGGGEPEGRETRSPRRRWTASTVRLASAAATLYLVANVLYVAKSAAGICFHAGIGPAMSRALFPLGEAARTVSERRDRATSFGLGSSLGC